MRHAGRRENKHALDNVIIAQLFQQADFSDRSAWHAFVFSFEADFLEGDDSIAGCVSGFVDNTIRSWSHLSDPKYHRQH